MGAESVTKVLKNQATSRDVQEELSRLKKWADDYYGHQEGYSGSWNTINGSARQVVSKTGKPFNSANEALDALESQVEKWDAGYAHFCATTRNTESKEVKKITAKTDVLTEKIKKIQTETDQIFDEIREFKKNNGAKKVSCATCDATYKLSHQPFILSHPGDYRLKILEETDASKFKKLLSVECVVCRAKIESIPGLKNLTKKIDSNSEKIIELMIEREKLNAEARKASEVVTGEIFTLIYGLAAC